MESLLVFFAKCLMATLMLQVAIASVYMWMPAFMEHYVVTGLQLMMKFME